MTLLDHLKPEIFGRGIFQPNETTKPMVIPASRVGFHPLVKTLRQLIQDQTDGPQRLVRAVLFLWQKKAYPTLAIRAPYGTKELLDQNALNTFVAWLSEQDFNDAAYWLASAYANWVGEEVRTKQALYFTPPRLADRVIDDLVSRGASLTNHHWHDPACGGAAFLVPTAQRMAEALSGIGFTPREVLKKVQAQLSGNDLDKTLLAISEQFLRMALYPYISATGVVPTFELLNVDGLLANREGKAAPDVLACNPPYRKLNAEETRKYQSKFGDVIRNQPNMYGLFIRKALDVVKEGGLVGLLTPTSFLSGSSFSKLRTGLLERSDVLNIDMLSDRTSLFISVEQEAAISILRTRKKSTALNSMTDVCVLNPQGEYKHVGQRRLSANGVAWSIPRSVSDSTLLHETQDCNSRLADYGYTPKVGHLVAFRDTRPRFAERPKPRHNCCVVPIIWAGDITCGMLDHGRTHQRLRTDYFIEVSAFDHASVLSGPSVVLQRLTSNDQPHRLIAAPVPSDWQNENGGYVAENHVIVLQTQESNPWSPEIMASLLNSPMINRLYRSISGASNVAVSELKELPLPNPADLRNALDEHSDIDVAIAKAFRLSA
jgi:adenine-specific DNA-methyltransferase